MTEAALSTTSTPPAGPPPPPPTPPASPASPQPQQRPGVIADNAYARLAPAEQDRYALVRKGPEGGSEWRARDQLPSEAGDGRPPGAVPAPGDGTPTVTADGVLRVGSMELSEADIRSLMETKAQADLRATQIPARAEAYEARLPEGFKLPDGQQWQFDTNSPTYLDARAWAHKAGLSQGQWSEALSFFASSQIADQQQYARAAAAEVDKLGANAMARVTAVDTWLRSALGDQAGRDVRAMLVTAKSVEAMEKLLHRVVGQGAASFSQAHREPIPSNNGPLSSMDEASYNALSASERYRISRTGQ